MYVTSTLPITCGNQNFFTKLPAAFSTSSLVDGKTTYFFHKMFIMRLTTTRKTIVNSVHLTLILLTWTEPPTKFSKKGD